MPVSYMPYHANGLVTYPAAQPPPQASSTFSYAPPPPIMPVPHGLSPYMYPQPPPPPPSLNKGLTTTIYNTPYTPSSADHSQASSKVTSPTDSTAPPPTTATSSSTIYVHVDVGHVFQVQLGDKMREIVGPATVKIVNNDSTQPVPLQLTAPAPGQYVQQVLDENGMLVHLIISSSPQPHSLIPPPPPPPPPPLPSLMGQQLQLLHVNGIGEQHMLSNGAHQHHHHHHSPNQHHLSSHHNKSNKNKQHQKAYKTTMVSLVHFFVSIFKNSHIRIIF